MTLQEITIALSSSLAAELAPALRELAHMADDGAVADLQMYISHVSSKRILGHADFNVRAAAVAALAALVKQDEDSAAGAKRKAPGWPPMQEAELKNHGHVELERAKQKRREEAEHYSAFIATQYYYYLEVPLLLCAFSYPPPPPHPLLFSGLYCHPVLLPLGGEQEELLLLCAGVVSLYHSGLGFSMRFRLSVAGVLVLLPGCQVCKLV